MEEIQNLCVFTLGFIFILFFISENNDPQMLSSFIFTDIGVIILLVILVLLFNLYNPLVVFIGCLVFVVLLSKLSSTNILKPVDTLDSSIQSRSDKRYESKAFKDCRKPFHCNKDNLEIVAVQSMLPYVDDSVVDSKPSWKPVLCKPIVN